MTRPSLIAWHQLSPGCCGGWPCHKRIGRHHYNYNRRYGGTLPRSSRQFRISDPPGGLFPNVSHHRSDARPKAVASTTMHWACCDHMTLPFSSLYRIDRNRPSLWSQLHLETLEGLDQVLETWYFLDISVTQDTWTWFRPSWGTVAMSIWQWEEGRRKCLSPSFSSLDLVGIPTWILGWLGHITHISSQARSRLCA